MKTETKLKTKQGMQPTGLFLAVYGHVFGRLSYGENVNSPSSLRPIVFFFAQGDLEAEPPLCNGVSEFFAICVHGYENQGRPSQNKKISPRKFFGSPSVAEPGSAEPGSAEPETKFSRKFFSESVGSFSLA